MDLPIAREKSAKLHSALKITRTRFKDKELLILIRARDKGLSLTESYFSKYKNAVRIKSYRETINPGTFEKILIALDKILFEEFNYTYNLQTKAYEYLQPENDNFYDGSKIPEVEKLKGLFGVWIGLSFNRKKSAKEQKPYYSRFKIVISDFERIRSGTERANFSKGRIRLISVDRISIEILNEHRTIFMISKIGVGAHLEKLTALNIAYADSGDLDVRCGLGVLIKTAEPFESIQPKSISITDEEMEIFREHLDFLGENQYPAPPSDI